MKPASDPSPQRTTVHGWRHLSDIRFTRVHWLEHEVGFDAVDAEGRTVRFVIDEATLRGLSDRDEPASMQTMFGEHLAQIRGVAARLVAAGARGEPIRLTAALFGER